MKLYATTTSERASKGQGGNEYLDIAIRNDTEEIIALISFYPDGTCTAQVKSDIRTDFDQPREIDLHRRKSTAPICGIEKGFGVCDDENCKR